MCGCAVFQSIWNSTSNIALHKNQYRSPYLEHIPFQYLWCGLIVTSGGIDSSQNSFAVWNERGHKMGTDLDQFVHPERISSQLICPICTQVLKKPVQTSTDHLFCEDELLEWMARSNICPVSKQILDPEKITRPSRIILNMLAELEIFCLNKAEGCSWSGAHEHLERHLATCTFRPRSELYAEIQTLKDQVLELEATQTHYESRNEILMEENSTLRGLIEEYQQRLRVFHALLPQESRPTYAFEGDESFIDGQLDESGLYAEDAKDSSFSCDRLADLTDLDRLRKLRTLRSLHTEQPPNSEAKRYHDDTLDHASSRK